MNEQDRFRGALLGLAAGDAVGVTLEFCSRGSAVLTDMVGGGAFGLRPGEWTDDTAMALCLATSLLEKNGFDAEDQMQRYVRWWETGYLSSTGRCFDIGSTVEQALRTYIDEGRIAGPSGKRSAGNGSIMRLAPVPMFYYPDEEAAIIYSAESSRPTHGAEECIDACRLLGGMIFRALAGRTKEDVLRGDAGFRGAEKIAAIARGEYAELPADAISGTGYVVKSLEAALWCFHHSDSFPAAVLKAANLGDDADTTAAVCGQLAGSFYGIEGIPAPWRERVVRADEILALADRLYAARPPRR